MTGQRPFFLSFFLAQSFTLFFYGHKKLLKVKVLGFFGVISVLKEVPEPNFFATKYVSLKKMVSESVIR